MTCYSLVARAFPLARTFGKEAARRAFDGLNCAGERRVADRRLEPKHQHSLWYHETKIESHRHSVPRKSKIEKRAPCSHKEKCCHEGDTRRVARRRWNVKTNAPGDVLVVDRRQQLLFLNYTRKTRRDSRKVFAGWSRLAEKSLGRVEMTL